MKFLDPKVTEYLEGLAKVDDEPVLIEMEEFARENGFPIVGRLCGQVIEIAARSIGAQRIFEMGSGYGYSAYWFARATGPGGEIHLTDGDPENERRAIDYLTRANKIDAVTYHVGNALELIDQVEGEFDIVYCDIDKDGYPEAWRKARDRVRVGGMFICDNMLWSGRVAGMDVEGSRPDWTEAIAATNQAIANDSAYRMTIVPLRDGLLLALRIS